MKVVRKLSLFSSEMEELLTVEGSKPLNDFLKKIMHSQISVSQADCSTLLLQFSLLPCTKNQPPSSYSSSLSYFT